MYAKYIEETRYPNLRKFALKIISVFGSTALCESFFSKMSFCKNKYRGSISDQNLKNQLRIATSKIDIDMDDLSKFGYLFLYILHFNNYTHVFIYNI